MTSEQREAVERLRYSVTRPNCAISIENPDAFADDICTILSALSPPHQDNGEGGIDLRPHCRMALTAMREVQQLIADECLPTMVNSHEMEGMERAIAAMEELGLSAVAAVEEG